MADYTTTDFGDTVLRDYRVRRGGGIEVVKEALKPLTMPLSIG